MIIQGDQGDQRDRALFCCIIPRNLSKGIKGIKNIEEIKGSKSVKNDRNVWREAILARPFLPIRFWLYFHALV